jgi:hypothetical protein
MSGVMISVRRVFDRGIMLEIVEYLGPLIITPVPAVSANR